MMEDSIRFYVFADFFRILQFPIREVVDQLLGSFRLFVEIHQTVLDFLKVVALFKNAGSYKLGDKIVILKVDIDKNEPMAAAFRIQSVPTLMLWKKGQIAWRQSGALPLHELEQILSAYL